MKIVKCMTLVSLFAYAEEDGSGRYMPGVQASFIDTLPGRYDAVSNSGWGWFFTETGMRPVRFKRNF